MSFSLTHRPLSAIAATALLLAATTANANSLFGDKNCLFKSSMIQKGGENTPTSVYKNDNAAKEQYCSPTAMNDARPSDYNDRERMHMNNHRAGQNNSMQPAAGY